MEFSERMFAICDRVLIVDTHISLQGGSEFTWKGKTYTGQYAVEHADSATETEIETALWKAIANRRSFLFNRASLLNLFKHVGFTSVYECLNPYEYHEPDWPKPSKGGRHVIWLDRATFVAIKGQKEVVLSSPVSEASIEPDRPEKPDYIYSPPVSPRETGNAENRD